MYVYIHTYIHIYIHKHTQTHFAQTEQIWRSFGAGRVCECMYIYMYVYISGILIGSAYRCLIDTQRSIVVDGVLCIYTYIYICIQYTYLYIDT